jgi:hypothetical protein
MSENIQRIGSMNNGSVTGGRAQLDLIGIERGVGEKL